MKHQILILGILLFCGNVFAQNDFTLSSPNGKLEIGIYIGNTIEYSVAHNGDLLLDKSPLSMELTNGTSWGINAKINKVNRRTVNETIEALVYKKKYIKDNFNEITLECAGNYNIIFRAYDDGVAYRFISTAKNLLK